MLHRKKIVQAGHACHTHCRSAIMATVEGSYQFAGGHFREGACWCRGYLAEASDCPLDVDSASEVGTSIQLYEVTAFWMKDLAMLVARWL